MPWLTRSRRRPVAARVVPAKATTPPPPPPARRDGDRPARIPLELRHTAQQAADRARDIYPGAAGTILSNEIRAWVQFGYLGRPDTPIAQLIAQLTDPAAQER